MLYIWTILSIVNGESSTSARNSALQTSALPTCRLCRICWKSHLCFPSGVVLDIQGISLLQVLDQSPSSPSSCLIIAHQSHTCSLHSATTYNVTARTQLPADILSRSQPSVHPVSMTVTSCPSCNREKESADLDQVPKRCLVLTEPLHQQQLISSNQHSIDFPRATWV